MEMSAISYGVRMNGGKDLTALSGSDDFCKDQSSAALKITSLKIYKGSDFQLNLGRFHATVQCPG